MGTDLDMQLSAAPARLLGCRNNAACAAPAGRWVPGVRGHPPCLTAMPQAAHTERCLHRRIRGRRVRRMSVRSEAARAPQGEGGSGGAPG